MPRSLLPLFRRSGTLVASFAALWLSGCGGSDYDSRLPNSNELGNPRGLSMSRVIAHYHSPYSWDACDRNGLPDGAPNAGCLTDLKTALCANHVDFLFLTDHPDAMARFEMDRLVLAEGTDQVLTDGSGHPYGNTITPCADGFTPTILPGFESQLMAFGMLNHLPGSPSDRETLYNGETGALATQLRTGAGSLVFIPHTESRSLDTIRAVAPDGIEIYNIHANLDPKIRRHDLGISPFGALAKLISYLVDPYGDLNADQFFFQFAEIEPVYFQKWNQLTYEGLKLAGIGGTDSHENILRQRMTDGDRLDSHRRLTRFMSNHLIVHDRSLAEAKDALKHGRGWLVFEGFGTPVGMDFYAVANGATLGVSDSGTLGGGNAAFHVKLPRLHPSFPRSGEDPLIRIDLKHVIAGGQDETVASAYNSDLDWNTSVPGAYRAELHIYPRHLRGFLGPYAKLADKDYLWIVTNHVYLAP